MMRLVYLPVNQVYAFVFGETLLRLHLPENLGPADLFFKELGEATRVATLCGLVVGSDGEVRIKAEDQRAEDQEPHFEMVSSQYSAKDQGYIFMFKLNGVMHRALIPDGEDVRTFQVEQYCIHHGTHAPTP